MVTRRDVCRPNIAAVGVYISEGMGVRIPAGGLTISIDEQGAPSVQVIEFQVSLDVWPYWIDIGMDHADLARKARRELEEAVAEDRDADKGIHLEAECKAGMVACSAAGFALDAFYESIRWHLPGMDALIRDWNRAGTPRHRRVAETIRRGTVLTNEQGKDLQRGVREVFKYRSWAVHPPADFRAPVVHDLLGAGVEWRFMAFRSSNASDSVGLVADIITRCVRTPRRVNSTFVEWTVGAAKRVLPRQERFDSLFG